MTLFTWKRRHLTCGPPPEKCPAYASSLLNKSCIQYAFVYKVGGWIANLYLKVSLVSNNKALQIQTRYKIVLWNPCSPYPSQDLLTINTDNINEHSVFAGCALGGYSRCHVMDALLIQVFRRFLFLYSSGRKHDISFANIINACVASMFQLSWHTTKLVYNYYDYADVWQIITCDPLTLQNENREENKWLENKVKMERFGALHRRVSSIPWAQLIN